MTEPVYLDSSVVVAYYLPEALSERVQSLFDGFAVPVISELVELEVLAAISLRHRIGELAHAEAHQAASLFTEHVDSGLYARLHLRTDHYQWARNTIARLDLPLKSPDALHLAMATSDGFRLVTADRQLARNAGVLDVTFDLIEV